MLCDSPTFDCQANNFLHLFALSVLVYTFIRGTRNLAPSEKFVGRTIFFLFFVDILGICGIIGYSLAWPARTLVLVASVILRDQQQRIPSLYSYFGPPVTWRGWVGGVLRQFGLLAVSKCVFFVIRSMLLPWVQNQPDPAERRNDQPLFAKRKERFFANDEESDDLCGRVRTEPYCAKRKLRFVVDEDGNPDDFIGKFPRRVRCDPTVPDFQFAADTGRYQFGGDGFDNIYIPNDPHTPPNHGEDPGTLASDTDQHDEAKRKASHTFAALLLSFATKHPKVFGCLMHRITSVAPSNEAVTIKLLLSKAFPQLFAAWDTPEITQAFEVLFEVSQEFALVDEAPTNSEISRVVAEFLLAKKKEVMELLCFVATLALPQHLSEAVSALSLFKGEALLEYMLSTIIGSTKKESQSQDNDFDDVCVPSVSRY